MNMSVELRLMRRKSQVSPAFRPECIANNESMIDVRYKAKMAKLRKHASKLTIGGV